MPDMKETIILLLNRENTGPNFGYRILGREFNKRGYETLFIDALSGNADREIAEAYERRNIAFTLTHNTLKIDLKSDGMPFFEKYRSVCISLTDTPLPK